MKQPTPTTTHILVYRYIRDSHGTPITRHPYLLGRKGGQRIKDTTVWHGSNL